MSLDHAPAQHGTTFWADVLVAASLASPSDPAPLAVRDVADRLGLSVEAAGRRLRAAIAYGLLVEDQTYTLTLARMVHLAPEWAWLADLHRWAPAPVSHPAYSPAGLGSAAWLARALTASGYDVPSWLVPAMERTLAATGSARPGLRLLRRYARRLGLHRARALWSETIAAQRAAYHGTDEGDGHDDTTSRSVRTPLGMALATLLVLVGTLSGTLVDALVDALRPWEERGTPLRPTPPALQQPLFTLL